MPAVRSRLPDNIWELPAYRAAARDETDYARLLVDGARKAIDAATYPHPAADADAIRADLHRFIGGLEPAQAEPLASRILATGSPTYNRAFEKLLRGLPLDSGEVGALSLGTAGEGGYAVPFDLDPTIILTSNGAINPLRQLARVERVMGRRWQGLTSAGATVSRGAEAAEAPDTQFTLAQPEVDTIEVKAFVRFTMKLEAAWGSLRAEIARVLQDAKDVEEATTFITGDGTGTNPGGLVGSMPAGRIITTGGSGQFGVEDVYRVKNAVAARWRGRGAYLAEGAIYDAIRQFDTSGGAALWVQLAGPNPPTLAGRPAYEISTMDAAIADGNEILVYGDFSQFLIVDRIGMTVELVPHVFGANQRPTGERGVFALWSNNARILVPEAFAVLRVGV
jgi:HK97 family phage major capsid protein